MFDLGWLEILIIAVTALIVVGPKDLPNLFKKVGVFVGKAKAMGREFQRGMEDAADQSGLNEASAAINKMNSLKETPTNLKRKVVNEYFEKGKTSGKFSSVGKSEVDKKDISNQTKKKITKNDSKTRQKTIKTDKKDLKKQPSNFKSEATKKRKKLTKSPKVVSKKNTEEIKVKSSIK